MPCKFRRILICVSTVIVFTVPLFAQVSFFSPPVFQGSGNIFVADFNGDGKADILTSDGTLQLGLGGGAFAPPTTVPGTPLLVADINGDHIPDILEQGTNSLLVLLGNGDGTFQPAITTSITANLVSLAAADLNGDGRADVVAVSGSSLLVFISKGDGTFSSPVTYSLGTNSVSSAVFSFGDFNNDGKVDIAVAIPLEEIVFPGNGDGTFNAPAITSVASGASYAAVGDFNGDGKLDIALSFGCETYCPGGSIQVLLGNGDGTFAPGVLFGGSGPLVAADVNGDGKLDLLSQPFDLVQVYPGNGDGTFANPISYAGVWLVYTHFGLVSSGLVAADFNGDGKPDLAVGGGAIFFGNGDGTFQGAPFVPTPISSVVGGAFGPNHAPAIAVLNGGQINIFEMNGAYSVSLIHTYTLPQSGSSIVAADFNGDGNIDLVVVGADSSNENWNYTVLLGNADGSFQSPTLIPQTGALTGSVAVGDFNNDQKLDLVVGAGGQDQLAVLLGKGDGTFAPPVYSQGTQSSLIADFNGDGKLDIAVGVSGVGTTISYGNGDGTFQPPVSVPSLNGFWATLTADLNNDGRPDLVCAGCQSHVALGNGDGTFTIVPEQFEGLSAQYVPWGIADFNGDGIADYLAYNPGYTPMVMLGIGDGTFQGVGQAVGLPGFTENTSFPLLIADVNGDGLPDVLLTLPEGPAGFAVLLNTTAAAPRFQFFASPLSPAIVTAGDSATANISISPLFGFTGTVNLSCTVTSDTTPAPTCSLSNSSVQIVDSSSKSITVTIETTAPTTSAIAPFTAFPAFPLAGMLIVLGSAWLSLSNRGRRQSLAFYIMIVGLACCIACGGKSSNTGTPSGKSTVTLTASSGALTRTVDLQIVVQ